MKCDGEMGIRVYQYIHLQSYMVQLPYIAFSSPPVFQALELESGKLCLTTPLVDLHPKNGHGNLRGPY